ncbi:MAG: A24 family peptidase [Limnochordia bacterium]
MAAIPTAIVSRLLFWRMESDEMVDNLLLGGVLMAGLWDVVSRRIPNWLTFGLMACGLIAGFYFGGLDGLTRSLQGLLLGGLLLLLPFVSGGMGAGDVKMLAAVGALKGPSFVFWSFLYGALAGGLLAGSVMLMARGRVRTIPYGAALAVGTLAAFYYGGI